jgi:hypothetical protein
VRSRSCVNKEFRVESSTSESSLRSKSSGSVTRNNSAQKAQSARTTQAAGAPLSHILLVAVWICNAIICIEFDSDSDSEFRLGLKACPADPDHNVTSTRSLGVGTLT